MYSLKSWPKKVADTEIFDDALPDTYLIVAGREGEKLM